MRICLVIVWRIADPLLTAKWPGTLEELREEFKSKALSSLIMELRGFTRSELLPTRQDVLLASKEEGSETNAEPLEEQIKKAQTASRTLAKESEHKCLELLGTASEEAAWGLQVVSVKLDSLELADEAIIADMESMAQAQLAMKRKEMQGRERLSAANVDREAALQQERAKAEIQQAAAESHSKVKLAEARAQSEISMLKSKNEAMALAESKKN